MDDQITVARKKLKLSERELAAALGVNRSTVNRWKRSLTGIRGPAKKMLEDMLAGKRGVTQ